jgi:energy-coupling factor transport system permease protein
MIRHPLSWCAWATSALAAAFVGRNPFLQGLLLLVLINAVVIHGQGWRSASWRIAIPLATLPILFSVSLSRFGRHVMFTLPPIPIVGGAWTWDAVAFGASSGMALLLTVAVFIVVQRTVRSADLLSLLPRPLYRAGTAVALALALAPQTVAAFHAIREARRLRGQRAGLASVPTLLIPLLLGTLERALQYGESLDARGYGSRRRSRYQPLGWTLAEVLVMAASVTALGLVLLAAGPSYNPYVDLVPGGPPVAGVVAILLLAAPLAAPLLSREDHAPDLA